MKSAVTIFFLLLMMATQTPFGQLLKLPLLVEHYLKHQQQYSVSLLGFLDEHYASNHKDADLPEDEQLPFNTIPFYSIGTAVITANVLASVVVPLSAEKKIIFQPAFSSQQILESIFHPPRV